MHIKVLTVFFIGFSLLTNAQKFSNSPFSSYGIGEFGGLDHGTFSGMGNTSIGMIDTTILNFNNPSSYASLGKGQPLFSTGISSRFSEFKEGNSISNSKYIGVDHFAIGIPFSKRFGLAFGLKPFSRTGYNFYEKGTTGLYDMKYVYRGSGGTNNVFTGFAANIINTANHRLGVGVNLGYIFGTTLNERISYIDQNYIETDAIPGGVENTGYTVKSLHTDFGLNYLWNINKDRSLTVGIVYTPTQKLTARQNALLAYSPNVNDPDEYTLVDTATNTKGHILMPSVMGIGFNYTMRPKNVNDKVNIYQLTFSADLKLTDWSNYESRFNSNTTENFANTTFIGVGVQFIPHYDYKDRSTNIHYLNRIRYRAGFQYTTLPLLVQNKQQSNMAVTAGLGFPFAIQRSSSSVNLGIVLGNQGNGNLSSVNERYIGINFGITISPGFNDRWFRKFKID